MSGWRPSVDEERAIALRSDASGWVRSGMAGEKVMAAISPPAWNTSSLVARVVFFALTAVGVSAAYAFLFLLHVPLKGTMTAVFAIAVAETLIRGKRFLHSGVEEALWIGALVFAISDLPSTGAVEALLLFAAALAVSGVRVLNGVFLVAAVGLTAIYFGVKTEEPAVAGGVFAMAAVIASIPLMLPVRRPWIERFLELAVALFPLAACVGFWVAEKRARLGLPWLVVLAALLAWLIAVASWKRSRAAIAGAMLLAGALAYDLIDRLSWGADGKLLVPGVALLAGSLAADRWLRTSRRGVTSQKLSESSDLRLVELAAAAALSASQQPSPAEATRPVGKGGEYGGAGASGEY